jgi:hypothetical protein
MRTFLAGFCAPEGPVTKTLGILPQKHPHLPWGQGSPWEFRQVRSQYFFSFWMRTFLEGFCAPEES